MPVFIEKNVSSEMLERVLNIPQVLNIPGSKFYRATQGS